MSLNKLYKTPILYNTIDKNFYKFKNMDSNLDLLIIYSYNKPTNNNKNFVIDFIFSLNKNQKFCNKIYD